jgi:DNA polymerase bacteriophage-type
MNAFSAALARLKALETLKQAPTLTPVARQTPPQGQEQGVQLDQVRAPAQEQVPDPEPASGKRAQRRQLKAVPTGRLKSTFEGPSGPAVILHVIRERNHVARGEGTDDEIIRFGRLCNVRRMADRGTIWLHKNWLEPHHDPDAWFLALVYRCCINDGRVAGEIGVPFPFDAEAEERYLAEMRSRKERGLPTEHYGHHAYTIYTYRGYDDKFEGHVECLLKPAWEMREYLRPRPGDTCASVYARLLELDGVGTFYAGQIVADCKFFEPLCHAPDVMTFAAAGPRSATGGSRPALARVLRKPPAYYQNDDVAWQRDFDPLYRQLAPEIERELGAPLSASDFQSIGLCEVEKFERYRVDGGKIQLYTPYGEALPKRARKARAPAMRSPEPESAVEPEPPRTISVERDPHAPHVLHRDYETRSVISIETAGALRYAADPSTEVLCCAYAVDDEPVQLWVLGDPIPPEFIEAARNPAWTAAAHNDQFESAIERLLLRPRYSWPCVPARRRRCTMAAALASALPGSLEGAAAALGLVQQKDLDGHVLMKRMAKPLARSGDRIIWYDGPERRRRLHAYCRQDVEVERELFHRLTPLPDAEQRLWQLDAKINSRGFHVDAALAKAAREIVCKQQSAADAEIAELTGGAITTTNQVRKILAFVRERGHQLEGLTKRSVSAVLARDPENDVRRLLELRREGSRASVRKFDALLAGTDQDGRMRGTLRFHGASTGRWSARRFQPQNLKRPELADIDPEAAIDAILAGDIKRIRQLGPPLAVVGDISRSMICAAPKHTLVCADFSMIEARVLAWLAGEEWKLENFRRHDAGEPALDPYLAAAAQILRRSVAPDDAESRQLGKTCELAFGFGGGLGAWRRFDPDGSHTDDEIERFKNEWRAQHAATVRFWRALENMLCRAVRTGQRTTLGRLAAECENGTLYIVLSSGRRLAYPEARLVQGKFEFATEIAFKDNARGNWVDVYAWYGTFVENVVQATARDLLAAAMIRIDEAGMPIVLHVHDELVVEVREHLAERAAAELERLMATLPDWATGLPIAVKIRSGLRYSK